MICRQDIFYSKWYVFSNTRRRPCTLRGGTRTRSQWWNSNPLPLTPDALRSECWEVSVYTDFPPWLKIMIWGFTVLPKTNKWSTGLIPTRNTGTTTYKSIAFLCHLWYYLFFKVSHVWPIHHNISIYLPGKNTKQFNSTHQCTTAYLTSHFLFLQWENSSGEQFQEFFHHQSE